MQCHQGSIAATWFYLKNENTIKDGWCFKQSFRKFRYIIDGVYDLLRSHVPDNRFKWCSIFQENKYVCLSYVYVPTSRFVDYISLSIYSEDKEVRHFDWNKQSKQFIRHLVLHRSKSIFRIMYDRVKLIQYQKNPGIINFLLLSSSHANYLLLNRKVWRIP